MIQEFYNKYFKDSQIKEEEIKLICSSPFIMMKDLLNRDILKDIRFQYFGLFEFSKIRAKYVLKSIEKSYRDGLLSERKYLERKKVLEKYES